MDSLSQRFVFVRRSIAHWQRPLVVASFVIFVACRGILGTGKFVESWTDGRGSTRATSNSQGSPHDACQPPLYFSSSSLRLCFFPPLAELCLALHLDQHCQSCTVA